MPILIKEVKGMDRLMLSVLLRMITSHKDKNEKMEEAISIVENGFDGVKEENL